MVSITRAEKDIISEMFPDIHIVRTMKQDSKRKHYFCTEDKRAMKVLNEMRRAGVVGVSE